MKTKYASCSAGCGRMGAMQPFKFYYPVKCECCKDGNHFETAYHCRGCAPSQPDTVKFSTNSESSTTKPINES